MTGGTRKEKVKQSKTRYHMEEQTTMVMIRDLLKNSEIHLDPKTTDHNMRTYRRLLKIFSGAKDARCQKKVTYSLDHLILMIFMAVLGGAEGYNEMQKFWEYHHKLYRRLFYIYAGVPSHDCFRHLLGVMDPDEMNRILVCVLTTSDMALRKALHLPTPKYTHVCVDGKELRGTGVDLNCDGERLRNLQSLNIYDNTSDICLFSKAIEVKTNEIPVAAKILGQMNLRNTIVTFDALHTQKNTISVIVSRKGDYVGGLKGNQGKILDLVVSLFTGDRKNRIREQQKMYVCTKEIAHNQLEEREFHVLTLTPAQRKGEFSEWEGIRSVVCYTKTCTNNITGEKNTEVRYYLSSLTDPEWISATLRGHWGVENRLHNGLDTVFMEDHMKVVDRNAAMNRDIIYKACLSLLRKLQDVKGVKGQTSKKTLRKIMGWDFEGQMSEALTLLDAKTLCQSITLETRARK